MSDQHSTEYGSFGSDPNPTDPFGAFNELTDPADPTMPIPSRSEGVGGYSAPPPPQQPLLPQPSAPQGAYASARSVASDSTGFLPALFDFTFTHFVTPKLVRFVYLLATIALAVGWLVFLFSAFAQSVGFGLVVLILGPVLVVIYLAVIRMTLEFYLSIVRMSEDVHRWLPQA